MQQALYLKRLLAVGRGEKIGAALVGLLPQLGDQSSILEPVGEEALGQHDHRRLQISTAPRHGMPRHRL